MIDKVKEEIEKINSNIDVLPTNNKKNIEKYVEYISENLKTYEGKLDECVSEIKRRKEEIVNKYNAVSFTVEVDDMDYNTLKLSDSRCLSKDKMNLDYLLFKLKQSTGSLENINNIIMEIINLFKNVGISLSEKDFNHTEAVNLYIKTLLNSSDSIIDVFNDIFFKNPNLLDEISLNIWYLFYKNKSKIDNYYKNKYATFDFHNYISNYRGGVNNNEYLKHNNSKYIYDLFINGELDINEYTDERKTGELLSSLLVEETNERNYENVMNFRKSLLEYKGFKNYEFIIVDLKELYSHKEEYKDLYNNKLKEISKEESKLFGLNKKINKKGLFKLNAVKLANAKLDRAKSLETLNNLYNELADLDIKEIIKNNFTNDTNYYDGLKFATYNFNYFKKLLETNEIELTMENIDKYLLDLQKYLYDKDVDVIDNIVLSEDKDLIKIICEKYQLNGIKVDSENIGDQIDKMINNSEKVLFYYDIKNLGINLDEIKYVINSKIID